MNILIVAKHSKYEWERKRLHLSHDELLAKYNKEHASLDAILRSHEKQISARENLAQILPSSTLIMMDVFQAANGLKGLVELNSEINMVLVLGGDNSFTCVSHMVGDYPILGINSDPERSVGCLTRWSIENDEDIFNLVEAIDFENYVIEPWTRLEATINGKSVTPATSEYFFGERQRNHMSRHVIVHQGREFEQKCSGIIFATGAGSTGWYSSASRHPAWSPNGKFCGFAVTEMYSSCPSDISTPVVECISPEEEIILYSLNDNEGLLSIDSWEEHNFCRGSEARIKVGRPLNVVVPTVKD